MAGVKVANYLSNVYQQHSNCAWEGLKMGFLALRFGLYVRISFGIHTCTGNAHEGAAARALTPGSDHFWYYLF